MIQIDRSIPLPERGGSKYPFSQMDVGDSFALPKTDKAAKSLSAIARGYSIAAGKPNLKFSVRTNGETVRIWRTA